MASITPLHYTHTFIKTPEVWGGNQSQKASVKPHAVTKPQLQPDGASTPPVSDGNGHLYSHQCRQQSWSNNQWVSISMMFSQKLESLPFLVELHLLTDFNSDYSLRNNNTWFIKEGPRHEFVECSVLGHSGLVSSMMEDRLVEVLMVLLRVWSINSAVHELYWRKVRCKNWHSFLISLFKLWEKYTKADFTEVGWRVDTMTRYSESAARFRPSARPPRVCFPPPVLCLTESRLLRVPRHERGAPLWLAVRARARTTDQLRIGMRTSSQRGKAGRARIRVWKKRNWPGRSRIHWSLQEVCWTGLRREKNTASSLERFHRSGIKKKIKKIWRGNKLIIYARRLAKTHPPIGSPAVQ